MAARAEVDCAANSMDYPYPLNDDAGTQVAEAHHCPFPVAARVMGGFVSTRPSHFYEGRGWKPR
jgi:hypothetical protein